MALAANSKFLAQLSALGLTENEAAIYLSLVIGGPSAALPISRATQMKRTTVYAALDTLVAKGIVAIEFAGSKRRFSAMEPSSLHRIMENRLRDFQSSLAELSALYQLRGGEALIKYYYGLDAVKTVYEGLLRDAENDRDYLVISNQTLWYELDSRFYQDFLERRARRSFLIRCILVDSPVAREHYKEQQFYNMKVKIFPKSTTFSANLVIIPQRLMIHHLSSPTWAMIVDNKNVVETHRQLFEVLWSALPG